MNRQQVIEELIDRVPPALAIGADTNCIFATRVGKEVAAYFGVALKPLPLRTEAWNREALEWLLEHNVNLSAVTPAQTEAFTDSGAWVVATDTESEAEHRYPGHLALYDPEGGGVLDLSLGQFARPAKNIVLPSAAYLMGFDPAEVNTYTFGEAMLVCHPLPRPRMDFRTAPDWKGGRGLGNAIAGALIRAIRDGVESPDRGALLHRDRKVAAAVRAAPLPTRALAAPDGHRASQAADSPLWLPGRSEALSEAERSRG